MKYLNWILLFSLILISCNSNIMENGLIIKDSPYDIDTTYNKLRTLISNNPNLKIVLELDHSDNATSADLKLNPTKIIMFGNPKLGTPLMQASQTTSIDLPQKIIIYSTSNVSSKIAYNDPMFLKQRHNIKGKDDILMIISEALNNITNKVISN